MVGQPVVVMGKVDERRRQPDGQGGEGLAYTHLHIRRHLAVILLIGLDLAAEVLGDQRHRPLFLRLIPVQAEVYAYRHRIVMSDVGRDELRRDAAHDVPCQFVGEDALDGNVAGVEGACLHVVFVGLLHPSVVHVLYAAGDGGFLAQGLGIGSPHIVGSVHIVHVADSHGPVAHRCCQGRVGEHQRRVVLDDGDVLSAQCSSVCAQRQPQEVVFCLAFLCPHDSCKKR